MAGKTTAAKARVKDDFGQYGIELVDLLINAITPPEEVQKATAAKKSPKGRSAVKPQESTAPREGSKTSQVVAMLPRKSGATLAEIMDKMGWQRHTVRGFMAGAMKKAGYAVESFKSDKGERTYRIN